MPARLPESQKQAQGTARKDRIPEPRLLHIVKSDIEAAQAALARAERQAVIESATLAREGTKVKTKDRRAKGKTRAHPSVAKLDRAQKEAEKYKRLLPLLAEELGRAEKIAAAAAAELPVRDINFALTSYYEVRDAVPPFNESEILTWLQLCPTSTLDLAQRKVKAGLPLNADEQSWLDGGKTPWPPSPSGEDFTAAFIARLRENAAKGFSTPASERILRECEELQKKIG